MQTPPASYRQRIDVHYSSLPRQAFATTLSTVSTSSGSSTATDSNANPKRNVAFGNCIPLLEDYFHIRSKTVEESSHVHLLGAKNTDEKQSDRESLPLPIEIINFGGLDNVDDKCIKNSSLGNVRSINKRLQLPKLTTSSSMNALLLATALQRTESNLRHMKSVSAQELMFDAASNDHNDASRIKDEMSCLENENRCHERANTEPPSAALLDDEAGASCVQNTNENTATETVKNCEMELTSDFDALLNLEKTCEIAPFDSKNNTGQIPNEIDRLRGFSVPNLGFKFLPHFSFCFGLFFVLSVILLTIDFCIYISLCWCQNVKKQSCLRCLC